MFGWFKERNEEKFSFMLSDNKVEFSQDVNTFESYYENNSILFSAINLVKNFSLGFSFFSSDDNGVEQVFKLPINHILHHLIISGNCFLLLKKNKIKPLNFHKVKLHIDQDTNKISFFEYKGIKYQKNEILHLKFQKSMTDDCGISPIKALQNTLEIYDNIMKFIFKVLKNDGKSNGIFSTKSSLNNKQFFQAKKEIQETYERLKHHEEIGLLQGDLQWQKIGMDFKELQILELKTNLEREICHVLNIPPRLLGVVDSNMTGYSDSINQFQKNVENNILGIISDINYFFNLNIKIKRNKGVYEEV